MALGPKPEYSSQPNATPVWEGVKVEIWWFSSCKDNSLGVFQQFLCRRASHPSPSSFPSLRDQSFDLATNDFPMGKYLLWDMGTGKTSIVLRFVKGQYLDCQESTIGAAFFSQILSLNEATIKFDIWDTAGQEAIYHSLAPMYYRAAAAYVLYMTFQALAKKWVEELQRQGNPCLVMALVANKADLEEKRKVFAEEGEQYAEENGLFFIETSAKTSQNVNELFYEIAKRVLKARPSRITGMHLHNERENSGRRLFCCST
ncbi:hypothetical protein J5N97_027114 [Dioscorea zingiberensis]|uniref:Uncharacterized protein n=1 Tax=Dioscorea zingiberensis TaxID=325984 RepID=A0A9D5C3M5_9LILI|nr:hypothetical protein J5N97_027114 [Dioscorea zingiberensis]